MKNFINRALVAKKHLKLFFALFAMLALNVGNAWAEEVTFSWAGASTATAGKTDYVVETAPITLTFAAGTAQNAPRTNKEGSVRMYANTTLTISCASGNITKVVFTPTGNTYNATKLSYNGTALTSDNWTLSSPSDEVTLTATAAARFKSIVVTYTPTGGGETSDPTPTKLTAPANLKEASITETSATLSWDVVANASNYSVTINGNTETVTTNSYSATGLTAGTEYTWSVVANGDGTNYTESVAAQHTFSTTAATTPEEPGGDGEETWILVTDASTLKADEEVIIAASGDNKYALSTTQKSSNRAGTAITKNGNTLVEPSADVQILTLKAGSTSGTFAFYTGTSGYLYAASSSSNQLKTKTTLDVHGSWTISITEGVASIAAKGSSNRNVMQYNYNNGDPLFNCYASASQTALAIYKKVTSSGSGSEQPVS